MKSFYIYQKKDNDNILLSCSSFSMRGFFFSYFFTLYNKMWLPSIFFISVDMLFWYIFESSDSFIGIISEFVPRLFLGFSFHQLKDIYLRKRGYEMIEVIIARTADEAQLKFLNANLKIKQSSDLNNEKWEECKTC